MRGARCAGLYVGKGEVVACVRTPSSTGKTRRSELRVFLTFTSGLEELADWLAASEVTEVVMEVTGQYWKPVWYLLEDGWPMTTPLRRSAGYGEKNKGWRAVDRRRQVDPARPPPRRRLLDALRPQARPRRRRRQTRPR